MARPHISPTEWRVLQAVSRPGASRRSAAHELGMSIYTVDSHLRAAYAVLGVQSAAQAIALLTGWCVDKCEVSRDG